MVRRSVRAQSHDGVEIAVHDLGGDGEALLICHATGFHGRAYEPLAAALRPHHHVWALDFRAHGDSGRPEDGDLAWSGAARDVLAAVDAIGADSVHAVGHSMGGAAALLAELERPGVLRSAYVFEPILLPDAVERPPDSRNDLATSARRRREVFGSKAEVLHRYASRPPLNLFRADALFAYVEHGFEDLPDGTVRLKCRAEDEGRTFESSADSTVARIRGLAVPTIVAVGTTEPGWSPAMFGPLVVEALADARLVSYPRLGHFGPLQDPEVVAEDVLAGTRATPG